MPDASTTVMEYLARTGATGARAVPLTGDASDRRYFRVLPREGGSFVVAVHAGPFDYATLPFVNTATLFAAMPVPVPRILGHAEDLGVLALEDLGDVTLQAHLGSASPGRHAALYREAVTFLEIIQRRGAELASPAYIPYGVAFDVPKLTWEMDFFLKHFLEAYRGVTFASREREALRAECATFVEELANEPRVLCHRDYHSRNLMLHGDRLCIIDFQDARLGPDTYDLVYYCAIRIDLAENVVDELIAYFLALKRQTADHAEFRRRFDMMALQRNLKALGTFGYQTTARRNTVYIQYMPRTLNYVRANLHKYPRFKRLTSILSSHVEELKWNARFGLSTHLFHGERLDRAHLETIAGHGFDLIEVFATRTHFDFHDPKEVDRLAGWLRETGISAGSMHAPICDGFSHGVWGRAFSNASSHAAHRQEAVAETGAAIRAARDLGCQTIVLHLGLPRGQDIPPGDNDPGAVRRSLESILDAATAAGVRLALEVIPNDLSTPDALMTIFGGDLDLGDSAVCLDFGHAHILSGAPEAADALGGHVITTHVHDNRGDEDTHLVPFSGSIDWTATLTAMLKIGYTGPWVFEVADHGDAAGVLRRTVGARTRLQAILDDLTQPFEFKE